MKIIPVADLSEKGLEPYRTLRRPVDHQREGIFVAEGEKVVQRLLDSALLVHSALMTPEWLNVYRVKLESSHPEIVVYVAEKPMLESIVGFHLHQGIMAVAGIPAPMALSDVLTAARSPRLLVAIDSLTNAENIGVLVRNCAAFGVDALIVGETSSSPYLRRAVRNSMGTVFNLPVVHVENLAQTLLDLRKSHHRVLGAHPHSEHHTLQHTSFRSDCCIVVGSEGEGISPAVLEACDEHFAIPMKEGVDSLNVASATAVVLYEASRQRERREDNAGGGSG
jgi:tRNA G18 (ribose-2'-O)-methylase SpoU